MSAAPAAKSESLNVLTLAFRPFFLAASLWSALALTLWIIVFMTGLALPSRFDPLMWHIHEMLFGFVLAAIAGFMLTAIPTWTGRAAIQGATLGGLVLLWLLGRAACLISAMIPLWLSAIVDLGFPFALCILAAREITASRNWRNLAMPAPIAVLGIANLLMYLELAGFAVPRGLGWRLGITAVLVLISVVGGRIIPNFTRNWLVKLRETSLPAAHPFIDRAALSSLHGGLIGWAFRPTSAAFGALLIAGAVLNFWRLAGWRGLTTLREPLLTILHLGYLWVIIGAALLGTSMVSHTVPTTAAIHALTAGAIGTMVLAVMTRVTRGHTGRALEADRLTTLIYLMISAAAVTRIVAAFAGQVSLLLLEASAALWVASFALFAAFYGPLLVMPRAIRA